MIDELAVEKRLGHDVRELEDANLVDKFLLEVVVDTVDLLFVEHHFEIVVECFGGLKTRPERLFEQPPGVMIHDAGARELVSDLAELVGKGRKIEESHPFITVHHRTETIVVVVV